MFFRLLIAVVTILTFLTACGGDNEKNVTTLSAQLSSETISTAHPLEYVVITARAANATGEPLVNASVQFTSTLGSFSPDQTVRSITVTTDRGTAQGQGRGEAQVRLYPGTTPGIATITVFSNGQRQTLTVDIEQNVQSVPSQVAAMRMLVATSELSVKAVSERDNTIIDILLLDERGELVETTPQQPDIALRFVARPGSDEGLLPSQAAADAFVQSEIELTSNNGRAQAILKTGQLPGVIQLEASYLPSLASNNPLHLLTNNLTVASGPAASITLSYSLNQTIDNLANGFYRRRFGALVTDRYGNAVADGTALSLGAIDTVLMSNRAPVIDYKFGRTQIGTNAQIRANSSLLTDSDNDLFDKAFVFSDQIERKIQQNDRLLILNAQPEDKLRIVTEISHDKITLQQPFAHDLSNAEYLIGTAFKGIQIGGLAENGELTIGRATVQQGIAELFLTYPSDNRFLQLGCLPAEVDERFYPRGTAQVWVIAQVNQTPAIKLDNNACFSAAFPFNLQLLNGNPIINQNRDIMLEVLDAYSNLVPYTVIEAEISYVNPNSDLMVTVGMCQQRNDRRTDSRGKCILPISIAGGNSGDEATVTLRAGRSNLQNLTIRLP